MCRILPLCVVLAALLVAGPVSAQGMAPAPAAPALSAIELPAGLDRVLRDYERAWRAADAAALAALFAVDGLVLQNGRPPVRGRAAVEAAYAGQGGSPLRLRALAFAVDGDVGYIVGGYRYGDAVVDVGKFTLTLRRAPDGRWEIVSDMDSPNAPARPAPAQHP